MDNNLLNEELGRMKSLFSNKNREVISEQNALPGGISQQAYDKIMAISKDNKKNFRGSYLAPAKQREIDAEFGAGTYEKFFNNGGRALLDKKTTATPKVGEAIIGTDNDLISISQFLGAPVDITGKNINQYNLGFSDKKNVIFTSPDKNVYVFFRFRPGGYFNPQNFVLKIGSNGQKTIGTFDLQNLYFKDPSTAQQNWWKDEGFNTIVSLKNIKGSATQEQKGNVRQTNINNVFCNVKGGVIILPNSKQNNVKWEDYKKVYKLNQNEILAAAKTCPNAELSKTVKTNRNTNVDVNSRFTKSASSLGIQNAKMDVQSLQTILNQLSGTQSSTVATGGQQPDLTTLQNAVTQLTNA